MPREDITNEVIVTAREERYIVICAPFEADSQFAALQTQGIIDAVDSIDTDILAHGIKRVFKSVNKLGKVKMMSYDKLTKEVLPKEFRHPNKTICHDDLLFYINMLGTDYIPKGKMGEGRAACANIMHTYLALESEDAKEQYRNHYISNHDTPEKLKKSINYWKHAPAFIIVPTEEDMTPKDALKLGEYAIELGSMSAEVSERGDDFYTLREDNPMLGFIPSQELRKGHDNANDADAPSYRQFFDVGGADGKYVRTGKDIDCVEDQYNSSDPPQKVSPGAIIDFNAVPLKFITTRQLELWLSIRGCSTCELDREQMETMVRLVRKNKTDALPHFVLRGGGGYRATSIVQPTTANVEWKTRQDMLDEIRGDKCLCLDDDEFMKTFFSNTHNSKRTRCLKHLMGGSYDLRDIKVSSDFKAELLPDSTFFVVEISCAPSQKGLGTEGKIYSTRLVFEQTVNGWILSPTPYSLCGCPVGVLPDCAHRGGAVLLLWAIRNCFGVDIDFDMLIERLPISIHKVATQLHLVSYAYPAIYTKDYQVERGLKEEASSSKDKETTDEDTRNDIDLEEENEREMQEDKKVPTIDVCDEVKRWCNEISLRGAGHRIGTDKSLNACVKAATLNPTAAYNVRKSIRMTNIASLVRQDKQPKTLYGYVCEEYLAGIGDDNVHNQDITNHMSDPYAEIYFATKDDDDDDDDEDSPGEYGCDGDNYYYVQQNSSDDEDYTDDDNEEEGEEDSN